MRRVPNTEKMSSYLPLSYADEDDKPRKLTDDEIKYVLSLTKDISSASQYVSRLQHRHYRTEMKKQLREIEICPSAIPQLRDEIASTWTLSIIEAGSPCGITIAEAIVPIITQMALNAFHLSGSASTSTADVLQSIIKVSAVDNASRIIIHFRDKMTTYRQALSYISEFQHVTTSDLLCKDVPYEVIGMRYDPEYPERRVASNDNPPLITLRKKGGITRKSATNAFLRLYLSREKLYRYRILPMEIADAYMRGFATTIFEVYADPNVYDYVDVHLSQTHLNDLAAQRDWHGESQTWREAVAVSRYVQEFMKSTKVETIKGIRGSTSKTRNNRRYDLHDLLNYEVMQKSITSFLKVKQNKPAYVVFQLKEEDARNYGLTLERVSAMFKAFKLKNAIREGKLLQVSRPKDGSCPMSYVNIKVEEAKASFVKNYDRSSTSEFDLHPLVNASHLFYASVNGNNLSEVFANPLVDSDCTYSTSIHAMSQYVSLDAGRETIVSIFESLLGGRNAKIHPAFINVLADYNTSKGRPLGADNSGRIRSGIPHFSMAMAERSHAVMANAAIANASESTKFPSCAIAFGQIGRFGTGLPIIHDPVLNLSNNEILYKEDYAVSIVQELQDDSIDFGPVENEIVNEVEDLVKTNKELDFEDNRARTAFIPVSSGINLGAAITHEESDVILDTDNNASTGGYISVSFDDIPMESVAKSYANLPSLPRYQPREKKPEIRKTYSSLLELIRYHNA